MFVKRTNVLTSGSLQVRRVGNIHHTRYLANLILRELLMHEGRLGAAMKLIQMHMARAGNELGGSTLQLSKKTNISDEFSLYESYFQELYSSCTRFARRILWKSHGSFRKFGLNTKARWCNLAGRVRALERVQRPTFSNWSCLH